MGVIGVIGTVEYSHAQTIMELNPLPNEPEPQDQVIAIQTDSTISLPDDPPDFVPFPYWYFTTSPNNTVIIGSTRDNIGHIFIPGPYLNITKNPSLPERTKVIQYCPSSPEHVKFLLTTTNDNVKGLKIPSNIKEQTNDTIIAGGFNWYPTAPSDTYQCPTDLDLEAPSKYPLITQNELRYTLYNQSDNKAYYFSPRENILQAQPIPLCTTETIDTTTQTLKGNTKMCYGKHGDNMVIITKKLTGFYGATETITTPKIPRDLDSTVVDDPDYLALLERLYLPPI